MIFQFSCHFLVIFSSFVIMCIRFFRKHKGDGSGSTRDAFTQTVALSGHPNFGDTAFSSLSKCVHLHARSSFGVSSLPFWFLPFSLPLLRFLPLLCPRFCPFLSFVHVLCFPLAFPQARHPSCVLFPSLAGFAGFSQWSVWQCCNCCPLCRPADASAVSQLAALER